MNETTSRTHSPWIPAGIAVLSGTAALVTGALLLSGEARVVAIAILGILVPLVAVIAACSMRRRLRRRIENLEHDMTVERKARLAVERVYTRFAEGLSAPIAQADQLSQQIGNRSHGVGDGAGLDGSIADASPGVIRKIEALAIAAQIDAGAYHPIPAVVHLDLLLPRVLNGCAYTSMAVEIDVRPAPVWCDPAAVHQALFNVVRTAEADGATAATVGVEESNGIGILTIADDRRVEVTPVANHTSLLATGDELPRHIVPALIEHQGGTVHVARQLGQTRTVIRIPLATPAQLAAATSTTARRETIPVA